MTTRQEKVNSLLQKEIAEYLRDQAYEELTGLLTITGVDVTADLEYAKVFFSVIGQPPEEVTEILRRHIYEIQGMVNRTLPMRKPPRVSFVNDSSGEHAAKIGKVIKNLHDNESDSSGQFPESK